MDTMKTARKIHKLAKKEGKTTLSLREYVRSFAYLFKNPAGKLERILKGKVRP